MFDNIVKKIETSNVYDVAIKSPLEHAPKLSEKLGHTILLKREDLQPIFSFKLRGAYQKITSLTKDQLNQGIIASSAGNHAQGVALSCQKLGINATIVMPTTTPHIKVTSVKAYGATVILHGDTYDEAYDHAKILEKDQHLTFIHPYDDLDVMAGQGTIAKEILEQYKDPISAIFIPVGGGGLLGGIAAYIKSIKPEIKIIAVEADNSACLYEALKANKRVILDQVGIFADGVAVKQIGKHPFEVAKQCVDDVVLVDTDEICAAIKDIFEETRSIVEPAGALAVAGIKKYTATQTTQQRHTFIALNCGANLNFDRLRHISERAEMGEQKELLMAVTIPEKPGSFKAFCQILGNRSITEFNYRYHSSKEAHIFVGISLPEGHQERDLLLTILRDKGYNTLDLSQNEMAKIHLRHMVGGKGVHLKNEKLYRFQFPERPGALMQFLTQLGSKWNISLFHYRSHGAAFGRVLTGLQIEPNDQKDFESFLKKLNYRYFNESDNLAYKLFL